VAPIAAVSSDPESLWVEGDEGVEGDEVKTLKGGKMKFKTYKFRNGISGKLIPLMFLLLNLPLFGTFNIKVNDQDQGQGTQPKVDELEFFKSGNLDFFLSGVRHIHANILTLNLIVSGSNKKNKTNWFSSTERINGNLSQQIESRNFLTLSIDSSVNDYSDKQNYYPNYEGANLENKEQEKLLTSILDPTGGLFSINLGFEFKLGSNIDLLDGNGNKVPLKDSEGNLITDSNGKTIFQKEDKKKLLALKFINKFGVKIINGTKVSNEKEYNGLSAYAMIGFQRDFGLYDLNQKKGGAGWLQFGGYGSLNQKSIMTDIFSTGVKQNFLGLFSEIGIRIEGLVFLKLAFYQCLNNSSIDRLRKPTIRLTLQMFNKTDTEPIEKPQT
jgi:hypothetical protein